MLSPISSDRWDFDAAAHLMVRAGFGVDPSEIRRICSLGPKRAVESLINAPVERYPPPAWATPDDQDQLRAQVKEAASADEKQMAHKLLREKFVNEMKDLTHWWVTR